MFIFHSKYGLEFCAAPAVSGRGENRQIRTHKLFYNLSWFNTFKSELVCLRGEGDSVPFQGGV